MNPAHKIWAFGFNRQRDASTQSNTENPRVISVDDGVIEPELMCLNIRIVTQKRAHFFVGDQHISFTGLRIHQVNTIIDGMVLICE